MAASVVVVGDALLDVVAAPSEPMRLGADVPAAVKVAPGGQGANLAVRFARRGVAVELVCALADDAAGRLLRETLAADGVRVRPLAAEATGAVIVLVDAAGERTMLSRRVPLARGLRDAPSVMADWLVVSGYLLLEPGAGRVAATLRGWAPRRMLVGCAVPDASLDAWQRAARAIEPDVVVLNRDEADRVPSLAGDRLVVTSTGGATARIGKARATVVTPAGGVAMDTTGAGDAFAAALLADLLDGWPPDDETLHRALEAVSSGAKSILDLQATLEMLETRRVPVVGYGVEELPAFYSASSGLPLSHRVDGPAAAAAAIAAHRSIPGAGGMLIVQPPPADLAIDAAEVDAWIADALRDAEERGIGGGAVTPHLLSFVARASGGRTLRANIGLIVNNARTAGLIASHLT